MTRTATMAENQYGERVIKIVFPFSYDDLEKVRSLSGRKFHSDTKCWSAPVQADNVNNLLKWGFSIDDKLQSFISAVQVKKVQSYQPNDVQGLKGEPYPFQKVGITFADTNDGRILNADDMGLGKAQPWNAKVLTPSGWKRMIDLHTGELIFGSDGKQYTITGVFPQGIKPIYRIFFSDGTFVRCCIDHLWTIQSACDRFRGGKGKVLSTKQLLETKLKKENGNANYFIPMLSSPIEYPEQSLPIPPYLLGAILGDGCVSQPHVSISNINNDILDRVKKECEEFKVVLKEKKKGDFAIIKKDQTHRAKRNLLKYNLNKLEIKGKAHTKFIPSIYKYSSFWQRLNLLRGLMDTDGYSAKKSGVTQFTTTSFQLCEDVRFLIESMGGVAKRKIKRTSFTYKEVKKLGMTSYTLTIGLPNNINPFYCRAKRLIYSPRTKYTPSRSISKIEYVKDDECICISVNSPDHLYVTEHCILTHNTVQALGYIQLHRDRIPAIIICPASLKLNWERECHKWLPNPSVEILSGERTWTPTADIIIINYDIVPHWKDTLKKLNPQILIMDEAHYIKNHKAKRTKAVQMLGKKIPHIIALSGTPIENRPAELYNAIHMINPELFPNRWVYLQRFCNPKHNGFGWSFNGATNMQELHQILTDNIMIRRKKQDVLKDLPDKTRSFVPLEIENRKEYTIAESDFISWVHKTKGIDAARKASNAEAFAKIEGLKQLAVKGKLNQSIEWIQNFLESGEKLIVFATHIFVIDALMDAFSGIAVKIDGSVTGAGRQLAVDRFQNDPSVKLFVGNIKAAGVGITLTAASNVAFLEYPWTPGQLDQAEDRAHRIGQKNSVNIYYLLASKTIEEDIVKMIDGKRKVVDKVLDGIETDEASLLSELLKSYI